MKKLRIGHIGTKHDHSVGKLDCVRKFPDVFEVVGVVEEDEEHNPIVLYIESDLEYTIAAQEFSKQLPKK